MQLQIGHPGSIPEETMENDMSMHAICLEVLPVEQDAAVDDS